MTFGTGNDGVAAGSDNITGATVIGTDGREADCCVAMRDGVSGGGRSICKPPVRTTFSGGVYLATMAAKVGAPADEYDGNVRKAGGRETPNLSLRCPATDDTKTR